MSQRPRRTSSRPPAEHHSVAAVFSPNTVNPSRKMMPAPRKPMPDTICAATRVGLDVARERAGEDDEACRAQAPPAHWCAPRPCGGATAARCRSAPRTGPRPACSARCIPDPRSRPHPRRSASRRSRVKLGIPVEVVDPAVVQVVRREAAAWRSASLRPRAGAAGGAGAGRTGFSVLFPLRRLQGEQAATTFSQLVIPPRDRGRTWSKVRSPLAPQYWQQNSSRRKRLKRVNATRFWGLT